MAKRHRCNWPGCSRHVKARDWACGKHWNRLPKRLRAPILAESSSSPGGLGAHADAIAWIRALPGSGSREARSERRTLSRMRNRVDDYRGAVDAPAPAPELAEALASGAIRARPGKTGVNRGG